MLFQKDPDTCGRGLKCFCDISFIFVSIQDLTYIRLSGENLLAKGSLVGGKYLPNVTGQKSQFSFHFYFYLFRHGGPASPSLRIFGDRFCAVVLFSPGQTI